MIRKLRLKFVVINMTLVMTLLAVLFFLLIHTTGKNLEQQIWQDMEQIAGGNLSPELRSGWMLVETKPFSAMMITGAWYPELPEPEQVSGWITEVLSTGKTRGELPEQQMYFLRRDGGGALRIVFAESHPWTGMMDGMVRTCLGVGALAFLAFLGLSVGLARWAVKPVEQAWDQQKQFVADASHELKTPLTVILTNAQLIQSGDCSPEEQRQRAGAMIQMAQQMKALVTGMLDLARMDNNAGNMVMEKLDLGALAEERAMLYEPLYFERGLRLVTQLQPECCILGSREHLGHVVELLLENGEKYSLPGDVTLQVLSRGGMVQLEMANPAPEMNGEELNKLFDRFYRRDASRSRDGSSGLGLAIAKSIVMEHRGKIWAEQGDGMLRILVEIPMVQKR